MASLFSLSLILISLPSFPSIKAEPQRIKSAPLLDLLLRDYTLNSYNKTFKTGITQNIHLPTNLSGIQVQAAIFRCGSLQRYGAKINEFSLNPGLKIQPCAERVILISQTLGNNWSSIYYDNFDLTGYEFVSPVLGLLAYNFKHDKNKNKNGSDPFEVEISGVEKRIFIDFGKTQLRKSKMGLIPLCATFGKDGKVVMKTMVAPNVCATKGGGHVALVVESPLVPERKRIKGLKMAFGIAIGAALGAFLLLLLLIAMFVKGKKKALIDELERRAYEEEAFRVVNVGNVRANLGARLMPAQLWHEGPGASPILLKFEYTRNEGKGGHHN